MRRKYGMDEMEMNFLDWIGVIAYRWKSIVVMMLVGAIVLGGYGYLKSGEKPEKGGNINVKEMPELTQAFVQIKECEALKASQQQYLQDSILMQMNASEVSQILIEYHVVANENEIVNYEEMVETLVSAYKRELQNDELQKRIQEELGGEIPLQYVRELISYENNSQNQDAPEEFGACPQKVNVDKHMIGIKIRGWDREACEKVAECIHQYMEGCTSVLSEKLFPHEIKLFNRIYCVVYDEELIQKKIAVLSNIRTANECIAEIEIGLTSEENQAIREAIEKEEYTLHEVAVEQMPRINVKYILLGIICGAGIMIGGWTLKYLLTDKLRTASELESMWGIDTMALTPMEEKKGIWTRSVFKIKNAGVRMFMDEDVIGLLRAEICIRLEKYGKNKFYVWNSILSERNRKIVHELQRECDNMPITIVESDSVMFDADVMMQLANADAVILFEEINGTTYSDLRRKVQLCEDNKIEIMCCVVDGVF